MNKECRRCHKVLPIERFHRHSATKDGYGTICKECRSEQERKRYAEDRERILNNVRKYRDENRAEIRRMGREKYRNNPKYRQYTLEYQKKYRENNREYALEYQKEYRENNREYINKRIRNYRKTPEGRFKELQKGHNRRILERECAGSHSLEEWENLKRKFNYTCPMCSKSEPEITLTEDHIVPLIKGGTNQISNIQPLCGSCNSKKGARVQRWAAQDLSCYIPDPSEEVTDVPT